MHPNSARFTARVGRSLEQADPDVAISQHRLATRMHPVHRRPQTEEPNLPAKTSKPMPWRCQSASSRIGLPIRSLTHIGRVQKHCGPHARSSTYNSGQAPASFDDTLAICRHNGTSCDTAIDSSDVNALAVSAAIVTCPNAAAENDHAARSNRSAEAAGRRKPEGRIRRSPPLRVGRRRTPRPPTW